MSFFKWFKLWCVCCYRFVTFNSSYKSEREREEERRKRIKAKYSPRRSKKSVKKRGRRSITERTLEHAGIFLKFVAVSIAIILLPFGLFDWGYKSVKEKRKAKKAKSCRNSRNVKSDSLKKTVFRNSQSRAKASKMKDVPTRAEKTANFSEKEKTIAENKEMKTEKESFEVYTEITHNAIAYGNAYETPSEGTDLSFMRKEATVDENMPKSIPKNKGDRYIRKRMIMEILDTTFALEKLVVGDYFEIESAKDSTGEVIITFMGEKIGCVPKEQCSMFITSMELGRKPYGVLTDIITDSNTEKYEFEAWFSQK